MNGIHFSSQRGKSYYYNTIGLFLNENPDSIIGQLTRKSFNNTDEQIEAWVNQVSQLQEKLADADCTGNIIFEYDIVRLGKRIDVVLLIKHMVFSLEFKNGATIYSPRDAEQAEDYALDLKNFHKESEDLYVCPILIATEAPAYEKNKIDSYPDKQIMLQRVNKDTMMSTIKEIYDKYGTEEPIDFDAWYHSQYCPTPTIIEAATEAYINHTVEEIARSEAGKINVDLCENEIQSIIKYAKENNKKCICFITGVPGAGKTLVGLDIAAKNLNVQDNTKAVYISGNGPLIKVLRKALVNNAINRQVEEQAQLSNSERKKKVSTAVQAFIQEAYSFRKDMILNSEQEPIENVLIFDEAQRCWSKEKLSTWVSQKMKKNIDMSEPQYFIHAMDRKKDWAVLICLVGLGQDIYDGEVGINEWFSSAIECYPDWEIYYSDEIFNQLEDKDINRELIVSYKNAHVRKPLHLSTSIRSFRSDVISSLIDNLLAGNIEIFKKLYSQKGKYDIFVTRDIKKAKEWARNKVRGSERCGVVACSSAQRLKPEGIYVPTEIDVENWFLAPKEDLRSSNAMEVVASEFKVQGLEIDYSVVCWDADLRRNNDSWDYYNFKGTKWQRRNKPEQKRYLLNAYRVLLTRARQGMVIFVPEGCDPEIDATRNNRFYDEIYEYLTIKCGIDVL